MKQRGFKEEWGCPNEVFFKRLEDEKSKDESYDKTIIAYEKCYEKISIIRKKLGITNEISIKFTEYYVTM